VSRHDPQAGRRGHEATLDVEPEQRLLGQRLGRDRDRRPLGQELLLDRRPPGRLIVHGDGTSREVGGILVVLAREGVHREAPVTGEVAALRTRHDEQVQLAVADDRAERVDPRRARRIDGAEEPEPDAELVEQPLGTSREAR
jgi:hypothetical protein